MKLSEHIKYVNEHCDDFITLVQLTMAEMNWCWDGSQCPPTREEIKIKINKILLSFDNPNVHCASVAGFFMHKNIENDTIEIYFGLDAEQQKGISFISEPNKNIVAQFIEFLSSEPDNHIDKDFLMSKYEEFKKVKAE